MFNPFRFACTVRLRPSEEPRVLDRLATIIPVFQDADITTHAGNRLTFCRLGFRGEFYTVAKGAFTLLPEPEPRLHVALSLRPGGYALIAFAMGWLGFRHGLRLDPVDIAIKLVIWTGFALGMMRGEGRRWTRQLCAAALARRPDFMTLDPAYSTDTAPELSSATV